MSGPVWGWQRWLALDAAAPALALVRRRIAAEGGLRAADFAYEGARRGEWWDWKPAKRALEYLYDCGELMISGRVNFQRVYDLPQRVLPAWVDTNPASAAETDRHEIEQALRALGICEVSSVADYAYMRRQRARPALECDAGGRRAAQH